MKHYISKRITSSKALFLVASVVLALAALMMRLGVEAHAPGVSLSGFGTATIDGVISAGEWDGAGSADFLVNIPEGGTTPGTLLVMNDADNLYLAVRFARSFVDPDSQLSFEFDNDNDGVWPEQGDDILGFNLSIGFFDLVRTNEPPCQPGKPPGSCGFFDTTVGGTNEVEGALLNDGAFTVYEQSHPLDSEDNTHDFSLAAGDTVGFGIFFCI